MARHRNTSPTRSTNRSPKPTTQPPSDHRNLGRPSAAQQTNRRSDPKATNGEHVNQPRSPANQPTTRPLRRQRSRSAKSWRPSRLCRSPFRCRRHGHPVCPTAQHRNQRRARRSSARRRTDPTPTARLWICRRTKGTERVNRSRCHLQEHAAPFAREDGVAFV